MVFPGLKDGDRLMNLISDGFQRIGWFQQDAWIKKTGFRRSLDFTISSFGFSKIIFLERKKLIDTGFFS